MQTDTAMLALYAFITLFIIVSYRAIAYNNNWRFSIIAGFGIFFFIYTGIGLSEQSLAEEFFAAHYSIYFLAYLVSFHVFSLEANQSTIATKRSIHRMLQNSRFCNAVIFIYITSSLLPLIAPEFKLHRLISPPSINFIEVFTQTATTDDEAIKKLTRYFNFLLLAPFLIGLGSLHRRPLIVFSIIAFLGYIEYVSSAYLSRSSILINLTIFVAYIIHQYPEKRIKIIMAIVLLIPISSLAAAWFLAFRLGTSTENSLADLAWLMIEIETNFPRDAGFPLYLSMAHGSIAEYLTWIFTIPIPKAFFGQFIDFNINYDITYILTGSRPGEIGFSVPLTGNMFASMYALGNFFWIEPLIAGGLTGLAFKTAFKYNNSNLLLAYILIINSYVYNRAGIGGFAPPIYNTFIWLLLLWAPALKLLTKVKIPSRT